MVEEPDRKPDKSGFNLADIISLIESRIKAFDDAVSVRFNSMDRAQKLFEENLTRVPTALDKAVQTQREYSEARMSELKLADVSSTLQREMILKHNAENLDGLKTFLMRKIFVKINYTQRSS